MPPKHPILIFDTSAAHCAAALICDDEIIGSKIEPMHKGQVERLFPLLEELMSETGSDWSELTALGVGIGPGNFTGIRISVSAARGLALSLQIPAIGISILERAASGNSLVACALPRDSFAVQHFDNTTPTAPPYLIETGHPDLDQAILTSPEINEQLLHQMAHMTAEKFAHTSDWSRPAPLYVRPADAAVSSEPALIILE